MFDCQTPIHVSSPEKAHPNRVKLVYVTNMPLFYNSLYQVSKYFLNYKCLIKKQFPVYPTFFQEAQRLNIFWTDSEG